MNLHLLRPCCLSKGVACKQNCRLGDMHRGDQTHREDIPSVQIILVKTGQFGHSTVRVNKGSLNISKEVRFRCVVKEDLQAFFRVTNLLFCSFSFTDIGEYNCNRPDLSIIIIPDRTESPDVITTKPVDLVHEHLSG